MTRPPLPWEFPSEPEPPQSVAIGSPTPEELDVKREPVPLPPSLGGPDIQVDFTPAVEAATNVAQAVVQSQLSGQPVEVYTTTEGGKAIRLTDARDRAVRTLLQNLIIDTLVALIAILPHFVGLDFSERASWGIVGLSVVKTVLATAVSYISRLTVPPSIPTPLDTSIGVIQPLPHAKS